MGQRQSSGGSGTATTAVPVGTARYRSYASSLTVDAGGGAPGNSGAGGGRNGGMPNASSASATPDRHHHPSYNQRSVALGTVGGRLRALSLGNFPGASSGSGRAGPVGGMSDYGAIGGASSPDSDDDSTDDGGGLFGALTATSSLPVAHLSFYRGLIHLHTIHIILLKYAMHNVQVK